MLTSIVLFTSLVTGPNALPLADGFTPPTTPGAIAPIANAGDDDKPAKERSGQKDRKAEREKKKDDDKSKAKDDKPSAKKIQSFSAKDMKGKKIDFPSDYKGKIVMLDFWATWCGPCMAEMPQVVSAYEKYHEKGFEVVGVTLDNKGSEAKIKSVEEERGMKWPQIFSGKGWEAPLAKKFSIRSIPQAFLVDGDTGEILAQAGAMRGNALHASIEAALARKAENQKSSKDQKKDAPKKDDGEKPQGEKKDAQGAPKGSKGEKPAGDGGEPKR